MQKKIKGYKKRKRLIIFILFLGIVVFGIILFFVVNKKSDVKDDNKRVKDKDVKVEKKIKIVDMDSNKRPYAVMINNHKAARPQAGLMDAYIIYEIMVEGGITRLMALYTDDKDTSKIGSIRSSRHNYLDYAMENDAIYVHWGYSTYAKNDISKLGIDNVNGLIYGNKYFVTDNSLNRAVEHTRFTSLSLLKQATSDLGYRTDTDRDYLLNYTADLVDLSKLENSKVANYVLVKFSDVVSSSYKYNSNDKYYYRSINGDNNVDLVTGEQYKFKNIIVYDVKYNSISSKGHQNLENIGSGTGYYITNGYATAIKWSKKDRASQTVYSYYNGEEIKVSDGNTFIEIYPTDGNLVIN